MLLCPVRFRAGDGQLLRRTASLKDKPVPSVFRRFILPPIVIAILGLGGCASTIALDHAVIAYDTTTADSISKQLLLNIARARYNEPIHFTAISNIAATYKLAVNAG